MANQPDALARYLNNQTKPTFNGLYGTLDSNIGSQIVNSGGTVPARYGPQAPPGSGGGAPPPPPPPTTTDWADVFWGSLGLPANLISQINAIFQKYPDQAQAHAIAQQTLRGSDWYKTTFPGISYGIQNGLFTDETGYRGYVNDINQLYQQYNNRNVTGDEISQYLQAGRNATYVGNVFQGNTIAQTEAPELQYEAGAFTPEGRLSNAELQAYGQEKAGIDTALGQQVTLRLQQAQQRLAGIFQGRLASPNLSLGPAGVYAPGLAGARERPTAAGSTDLPA